MQSVMKPGSLESLNSTATAPVGLHAKDRFRESNGRPCHSDAHAALSPANETSPPDGDAPNSSNNNRVNHTNAPREMASKDELPRSDNETEKLIVPAAAAEEPSSPSPQDKGPIEKRMNDNLQDLAEKVITSDPIPQKEETKKEDRASLSPEEGLACDTNEEANAGSQLSPETATKRDDQPIIGDTEESSNTNNKNDSSKELPKGNMDNSQIPPPPETVANKNITDSANGDHAKVPEAVQLPQETELMMDNNDSSLKNATKVSQFVQPLRDEIPASETETLQNGTEKAALPPSKALAEEADGNGNVSLQSDGAGLAKLAQLLGDKCKTQKDDDVQPDGENTAGATAQPHPVEHATNENDSTSNGTERGKENCAAEHSSPVVTERVDRIVNPLRSLVELEQAGNRASRKRKLFCLFRSYDSTKMDELASMAKVQRISQLLSPRKEAAVATARPKLPSD